MSQENVELVALTYDAWNRNDMDAMLATFHADFEFVSSGTFLDLDPVYAGHDGFKEFWHDFSETWDSILISVHELRDSGDVVLARTAFEAQGRDGLMVHRAQQGSIFRFRDGLIVRVENHSAWAAALKAVGLAEG
jgi:ketosteroid isomerase-like protein